MDPEDGYLYDFANNNLNFGQYRLFTYLSVYKLEPLYLYRLLTKNWYTQIDILSEFLEYMEYKEKETEENDYNNNNISSNDSDDESDDDD